MGFHKQACKTQELHASILNSYSQKNTQTLTSFHGFSPTKLCLTWNPHLNQEDDEIELKSLVMQAFFFFFFFFFQVFLFSSSHFLFLFSSLLSLFLFFPFTNKWQVVEKREKIKYLKYRYFF